VYATLLCSVIDALIQVINSHSALHVFYSLKRTGSFDSFVRTMFFKHYYIEPTHIRVIRLRIGP